MKSEQDGDHHSKASEGSSTPGAIAVPPAAAAGEGGVASSAARGNTLLERVKDRKERQFLAGSAPGAIAQQATSAPTPDPNISLPDYKDQSRPVVPPNNNVEARVAGQLHAQGGPAFKDQVNGNRRTPAPPPGVAEEDPLGSNHDAGSDAAAAAPGATHLVSAKLVEKDDNVTASQRQRILEEARNELAANAVKAEVVNTDEDEAARAEAAAHAAADLKRRRRYGLVAILCGCVILAGTVTGAVVGSRSEDKPDPFFRTTEELQRAVRVYLLDASPDTTEALQYGFPIGTWDVSRITNFSLVFGSGLDAEGFDPTKRSRQGFKGDLSGWDVSMRGMFTSEGDFNGSGLQNWDTSRVEDFSFVFSNCPRINMELIKGWNTEAAVSMEGMFYAAPSQGVGRGSVDLSSWTVGKVTSMASMFAFSSFDGEIDSWNVSSVVNMTDMFRESTHFNRSLCDWGSVLPFDVSGQGMFADSSCPNVSDPVLPDGPFCFACRE